MKKPIINNELLGILYMILCQFSFATNDAMVKFIYQNFDEIYVLNQVIFIRGIFALFFIGIFLYFKNLLNFKVIFSSRQLPIRGLFESFAAICFFIGVAMLPFGMVYVLLSLAPIFLTTFGALFLNEKVRWRRWTAVIFGFIYTNNIKCNFYSLQIAFITCLVVTIFFGFLSIYKFYYFSIKDYLILFVSSFFLSLGYIFSIATIKVALVSVTSTFRYSVIIWGILYGYFFFNEIPKTNTYIGGVMIVISGLIIISRQKQLGKIK